MKEFFLRVPILNVPQTTRVLLNRVLWSSYTVKFGPVPHTLARVKVLREF